MIQFIFEIRYYNEFSDKELTEFGMTLAESYNKALENIIDDYCGEDTIVGIKLISFDDGKTIELTKAEYEDRINGGNFQM